ncbi:MAG: hypothetical protein IJD30_02230, partial [Clostridia bacterium]|nr:hypothetical protein [Clostridia bacterium]
IENKEECRMSGTIKIINPCLLFEQLGFSMERAGVSKSDISEENGEYTITTDTDKYVFSSEGLHRMIFEGADVPPEFKNVFPLNMPKIDGMDYI